MLMSLFGNDGTHFKVEGVNHANHLRKSKDILIPFENNNGKNLIFPIYMYRDSKLLIKFRMISKTESSKNKLRVLSFLILVSVTVYLYLVKMREPQITLWM